MKAKLTIPPLNWFESNPWAKVGNKYTGSIGATSINNNAFLFRINYYRNENSELVAEVYDSIAEMDKSVTEYPSKTFEGTQQGRSEMIEWLDFKYNEFVSAGKDKLKIHYSKK